MTISPRLKQFRKKLEMKPYLDELTALLGRPVSADELGSLEEAEQLRELSQKFRAPEPKSFDILFSARCSDRFRRFVDRLHSGNPSSVYIWTPKTIICGALRVPSIASIRFDFEFDINADGILAFSTSDLVDSLLLDFSLSLAGEEILTVETQGPNWQGIVY